MQTPKPSICWNYPTYQYILNNMLFLKLIACWQILRYKRYDLNLQIYDQSMKGLAKYGQYIDDNKGFDYIKYAKEELADYMVYTAYGKINKK